MRLFDRAVLIGGTSLSVLIVPTIAEAWRTASPGAEWLIHADGPPEGTLHVAANAANGDNSPFGDLIYTAQETTKTTT